MKWLQLVFSDVSQLVDGDPTCADHCLTISDRVLGPIGSGASLDRPSERSRPHLTIRANVLGWRLRLYPSFGKMGGGVKQVEGCVVEVETGRSHVALCPVDRRQDVEKGLRVIG